jgi:XTP/dITP diphosphohydrolase
VKVSFATSNPHKVSEANRVARKFGISFLQAKIKYPEIRSESVSDVALEGARFVYGKVHKPVIVEDSGLFIKALDGFPGVYSRNAFDKIGIQGILDLMGKKKDRRAFFASAVAYSDGKNIAVFEGFVDGVIAKIAKGSSGFGFDPIFIPKGFRKTFAEEPSVKNIVSHRALSFEAFCRWLSGVHPCNWTGR